MTDGARCWKTTTIVLSVLLIVFGVSLFVVNPKKDTIYQINFQQWNVLVSGNGSGDKRSSNNIKTIGSGSEEKGDSKEITENEKKSGSENVCRTPECITLAQKLTNWGDKTADPCTDFYQYTCGRFTENVNTPSGIGLWKQAIIINMFTEFLARNKSTNSKSEKVLKKLYLYYKAVKDGKRENELDEQSLQDLDKDIQKIGEWPMISKNWSEESFVLNEYIGKIAELGMTKFGFFDFSTKRNLLYLVNDEGIISLSEKMKDVKKVLMKLLKLHNVPYSPNIQKDLDDVLTLSENINRITDAMYDPPLPYNYSKLSADNPKFDFEHIIVKLMNSTEYLDDLKLKFGLSPATANVYGEPTIELNKLIEETPPRVLANFFAVRSILNAIDLTHVEENSSYLENMIRNLRFISQWYVTHHFETNNRQLVIEILNRIKEHIRNLFQNSAWLHEMTKKKAIEKLNKMRAIVAFAEELAEPGAFDKIVEENLHDLPSDSFYTFSRKVDHLNTKLDLKDIANHTMFLSGPSMGAMYIPALNTLTAYAPVISEPLFDATLPESANIASVGLVFGHEIGHAFDSIGYKYDEDGNINDWWHPDDLKEFNKRTQCVIDKYDNYDDPSYGKNLNGTSAVGENSADIMGLDAAWNVYKQIDVSKEQKIIGFEDYPADKLFFRINALLWCNLYETKPLAERLENPHATKNYRVNGVFSNSEQFAKTFNCPVGSPMNSEKKCKIF